MTDGPIWQKSSGQISSGQISSGQDNRDASVREAREAREASLREALAKLDTSVAHPARVYDYWLGGKDNFAPDREAAQQVIDINPGIVPGVRTNRAFLSRVVRYLAEEVGIRQFLDLGTGLPSSNNVHEVAQAAAPKARVVYVDNDPIVLIHAHALLTGAPGTVDYVHADIRDPAAILRECARTLDLDQPVALLLLMTLQFITDDAEAPRITTTLLDGLAAGSHLVISHPAADEGAGDRATARYNELVATKMVRRTRDEMAQFFTGLDLVAPGLVPLPEWRPHPSDPAIAGRPSPAWCCVARKP